MSDGATNILRWLGVKLPLTPIPDAQIRHFTTNADMSNVASPAKALWGTPDLRDSIDEATRRTLHAVTACDPVY